MPFFPMPTIDPAVRYVGVSKLRDLNAAKLRDDSATTYVFQDNDQPLAVLINYETYLHIQQLQQQLHHAMVNTVDMLTSPEEMKNTAAGLIAATEGKLTPLREIKSRRRVPHEKRTK